MKKNNQYYNYTFTYSTHKSTPERNEYLASLRKMYTYASYSAFFMLVVILWFGLGLLCFYQDEPNGAVASCIIALASIVPYVFFSIKESIAQIKTTKLLDQVLDKTESEQYNTDVS